MPMILKQDQIYGKGEVTPPAQGISEVPWTLLSYFASVTSAPSILRHKIILYINIKSDTLNISYVNSLSNLSGSKWLQIGSESGVLCLPAFRCFSFSLGKDYKRWILCLKSQSSSYYTVVNRPDRMIKSRLTRQEND